MSFDMTFIRLAEVAMGAPVDESTNDLALMLQSEIPWKRVENEWGMEAAAHLKVSFDANPAGIEPWVIARLVDFQAEALEESILKLQARRSIKLDRLGFESALKALYLNRNVFTYYEVENPTTGETKLRWRHDRTIRGQSLLGALDGGNSIVLLQANPERMEKSRDLPDAEVTKWSGLGYSVIDSKVALRHDSVLFGELRKIFPSPVDFQAYVPGISAATIPNGLWMNQKVIMTSIRQEDGSLMGSDGSGRIHPSILADKIGRVCPVQIRGLNFSEGMFCKGILVPDERSVDSEGNPCIQIDWLQIKGIRKSWAKQMRAEDFTIEGTFDLGLIQAWWKPGKLSWNFEILENIAKTPATERIIGGLLQQYFDDLVKFGLDGVVRRTARNNDTLAFAVKMLETIELKYGKKVSAFQLQQFRSLLWAALGKELWLAAQGAGQQSPRYVTVIDNSIKPGTCVLGKIKVGTEVAMFRIPVVLSQGLRTLKVVEPQHYHQVEGVIIPQTVFLNEADLVVGMQGDDDGDFVGVDARPEIVELFSNLIDKSGPYQIEPAGISVALKMEDFTSAEVMSYLARDQRGKVGELTNLRSTMLSAGLPLEARAVSVLVQEAIDKKKRRPDWTDYTQLCYLVDGIPVNWVIDNKGIFHVNPACKGKTTVDETGHVDMKILRGWAYNRAPLPKEIRELGIKFGEYWCSWRKAAGGEKKVDPAKWEQCRVPANGGNLVHWCFNEAQRRFKIIEDSLVVAEPMDLGSLPRTLLTLEGINLQYADCGWEEYRNGLRTQAGIHQAAQAFKRQLMKSQEEGERQAALQQIQDELSDKIRQLTLEEQLQCWEMEFTHDKNLSDGQGNSRWGWQALVWEGSPFCAAIGLKAGNGCNFLQTQTMWAGRQVSFREAARQYCLKPIKGHVTEADPIGKLVTLLRGKTEDPTESLHFKQYGKPIYSCQDCTDELSRMVVGGIRTDRFRLEHKADNELVSALNQ